MQDLSPRIDQRAPETVASGSLPMPVDDRRLALDHRDPAPARVGDRVDQGKPHAAAADQQGGRGSRSGGSASSAASISSRSERPSAVSIGKTPFTMISQHVGLAVRPRAAGAARPRRRGPPGGQG